MFPGIGIGIYRGRFAGSFADSYSSRVLADGGTIESLSCVAGASALLQQASLLLIPSGYKAGTAYSALPNSGNGDLTWSRNSIANRLQSNVNIGSVGANVPRLSYMYGSCPSLLLEPQRTNLVLRSEEFDDLTWTKSGVSITANSIISPNGNTTAETISEGSTTGLKSLTQGFSITTSANYAISIFVKKDTLRYFRIVLYASGTQWFASQFDLDNLTFTSGVGSGGGVNVSSALTQFTNGWVRLTVVGNVPNNNATLAICPSDGTGISSSDFRGLPSYTGSNNQSYIWGAQVEAGAYATTYIPTTTASATRLADTFTRNNIYTNGYIGASGGTWYVELKNNVTYTRDNGLNNLILSDTTGNTYIRFRNDGTANSRLLIQTAVSGVISTHGTLPTDNVKVAVKWNGSTADIFVNGVKTVSATSFVATLLENLQSLPQLPIFIKAMVLYSTPLTDEELILKTTL